MNDNFMPDMPEREVDAYPYPNEDVRAYFAARGRQPTPDEQIVLDECLCADSRYNLLSTRYGDVRIADLRLRDAFRALLKSADRRTAFFHSVKSRCLVWKDPVPFRRVPAICSCILRICPSTKNCKRSSAGTRFSVCRHCWRFRQGLLWISVRSRRPAASSAFMICLQCVFWPQMNGLSTGYAHWCGRPHPMCRHP